MNYFNGVWLGVLSDTVPWSDENSISNLCEGLKKRERITTKKIKQSNGKVGNKNSHQFIGYVQKIVNTSRRCHEISREKIIKLIFIDLSSNSWARVVIFCCLGVCVDGLAATRLLRRWWKWNIVGYTLLEWKVIEWNLWEAGSCLGELFPVVNHKSVNLTEGKRAPGSNATGKLFHERISFNIRLSLIIVWTWFLSSHPPSSSSGFFGHSLIRSKLIISEAFLIPDLPRSRLISHALVSPARMNLESGSRTSIDCQPISL